MEIPHKLQITAIYIDSILLNAVFHNLKLQSNYHDGLLDRNFQLTL